MSHADAIYAARDAALTSLNTFLLDAAPGFFTDDALAAIARDASAGFTEGHHGATPTMTGKAGAAYLAYFGPRAICATAEALVLAGGVDDDIDKVTDLGAGTGAASLLFAHLGVRRLRLVDHDDRALHWAKRLLATAAQQLNVELDVKVEGKDLGKGPLPKGEFVVMSFAFSEVVRDVEPASDDEAHHIERVVDVATQAERLVLVDAGDRLRARRLMRLREAAVANGVHVVAPCPHHESCPALRKENDWCHLRIDKPLPDELDRFAAAVGRAQTRMSVMPLVLSKSAPSAPAPRQLRVLGAPQKEKGRTRLGVCGPSGVRMVQALSRHKKATKVVRKARPGDAIAWPSSSEGSDDVDVRDGVLHLDDHDVG